MNITKESAQKRLKSAPNAKTTAIHIPADATPADKTAILKTVVREIEQQTKRGSGVTLVQIRD